MEAAGDGREKIGAVKAEEKGRVELDSLSELAGGLFLDGQVNAPLRSIQAGLLSFDKGRRYETEIGHVKLAVETPAEYLLYS